MPSPPPPYPTALAPLHPTHARPCVGGMRRSGGSRQEVQQQANPCPPFPPPKLWLDVQKNTPG